VPVSGTGGAWCAVCDRRTKVGQPVAMAGSKTIVLTGATGFVGRQILRRLLERGHRVRVLLRDPARLEVQASRVDVRQTNDLFHEPSPRLCQMLADTDTLIHAAWYVEPASYIDASQNIDCLTGTLELAKAFVRAGGKRFVGIGTCFEYDLRAETLSVDTPLAPATIYAAAKASAFQMLYHYFQKVNLSFAWCRLFYLFGEGEHERRLVPTIRNALVAGTEVPLTDGTQIRDYMDVANAAEEVVRVALSDTLGPVNVCSGQPITVREMAENIADTFLARHLLRFGALPRRPDDPQRIVGLRNTQN
jgi:nucleoside-diphosphate-sugar epimerase